MRLRHLALLRLDLLEDLRRQRPQHRRLGRRRHLLHHRQPARLRAPGNPPAQLAVVAVTAGPARLQPGAGQLLGIPVAVALVGWSEARCRPAVQQPRAPCHPSPICQRFLTSRKATTHRQQQRPRWATTAPRRLPGCMAGCALPVGKRLQQRPPEGCAHPVGVELEAAAQQLVPDFLRPRNGWLRGCCCYCLPLCRTACPPERQRCDQRKEAFGANARVHSSRGANPAPPGSVRSSSPYTQPRTQRPLAQLPRAQPIRRHHRRCTPPAGEEVAPVGSRGGQASRPPPRKLHPHRRSPNRPQQRLLNPGQRGTRRHCWSGRPAVRPAIACGVARQRVSGLMRLDGCRCRHRLRPAAGAQEPVGRQPPSDAPLSRQLPPEWSSRRSYRTVLNASRSTWARHRLNAAVFLLVPKQ